MKRNLMKRWLPALLLALVMAALTACGAGGKNGANQNTVGGNYGATGNTQVAGENVTRVYAYIREVNPQARTVTVDEVTVVNRYDENTLNRLGAENAVDVLDDYYLFNPSRTRTMYPLASAVTFDLTGSTVYSRLGYEANGYNMTGVNGNGNNATGYNATGDNVNGNNVNGNYATGNNGLATDGYTTGLTNDGLYSEDMVNNEGTGDYNNSGTYNNVTNYNDQAFDRSNTGSEITSQSDTSDYAEIDRSENVGQDAYTDAGRNEENYLLKDNGNRNYRMGDWYDDDYISSMNSINVNRSGETEVLYLLTIQNNRVINITRVTSAMSNL